MSSEHKCPVELVAENLSCCICLDIVDKGVITSCSHFFCLVCIRTHIDSKQTNYAISVAPSSEDFGELQDITDDELQINLSLDNNNNDYDTEEGQEGEEGDSDDGAVGGIELSQIIDLNWDKCPICRADLRHSPEDTILVDDINLRSSKVVDRLAETVRNNLTLCRQTIKLKDQTIQEKDERIKELEQKVNRLMKEGSNKALRRRIHFLRNMNTDPPVVTFGTNKLGRSNLHWAHDCLCFSFVENNQTKKFYFQNKLMDKIVCALFRGWATIIIFPKKPKNIPKYRLIKQLFSDPQNRIIIQFIKDPDYIGRKRQIDLKLFFFGLKDVQFHFNSEDSAKAIIGKRLD